MLITLDGHGNSGIAQMQPIFADLAKAINTPLLPVNFDNHAEFVSECLKIQMSRRFSASGFSEAGFCLQIGNHSTYLGYESTSGTAVDVYISRDDNNDISAIKVEVSMPSERAQPGRCHYEAITQAIYPFSFREHAPKDLPIPMWVLDKEYWAQVDEAAVLTSLGFTPVITPVVTYYSGHCAVVIIEEGNTCRLITPEGKWLGNVDRLEELTVEFIAERLDRYALRRAEQADEFSDDDEYEDYVEDVELDDELIGIINLKRE
jgi:hypothetical protein